MAETTRITSSDLKPLAVMPQGLDNQYVPAKILNTVLKKQLSRQYVRTDFSKDIEAEYLRSLLYGEQVVVNRAFMINTPEIYKHFQRGARERETFMELVMSGAIIPWLFLETSLDQKPEFDTDPEGWNAVSSLVSDYKDIPSLRLS